MAVTNLLELNIKQFLESIVCNLNAMNELDNVYTTTRIFEHF